MQERRIQTELAEYVKANYDGENRSGIIPLGDMILVLPDQCAPKTASGLIQLPDEVIERMSTAAESGIIVAMGEEAFEYGYSGTRKWGSGYKPKVGDYIAMPRYSGVVYRGDDGQRYRLMEYTCAGALRQAPVADPPEAPAAAVHLITSAQQG